jgi:transposase-like protein
VSVHVVEVSFAGFRFPAEVIAVAVRWYLRYGMSFRDVEELLAERGVRVDHVTVYRWVRRFTPLFADAARWRRCVIGSADMVNPVETASQIAMASSVNAAAIRSGRGVSVASS